MHLTAPCDLRLVQPLWIIQAELLKRSYPSDDTDHRHKGWIPQLAASSVRLPKTCHFYSLYVETWNINTFPLNDFPNIGVIQFIFIIRWIRVKKLFQQAEPPYWTCLSWSRAYSKDLGTHPSVTDSHRQKDRAPCCSHPGG